MLLSAGKMKDRVLLHYRKAYRLNATVVAGDNRSYAVLLALLPCLWQQERYGSQQPRLERQLLVFLVELGCQRLQLELQFGWCQSREQQQPVQRLLCSGCPELANTRKTDDDGDEYY